MSLKYVLPFGEKDNVKNLIFTILTKEYPLKLIELTNYIKKRYGKSVTFQAVRKAAMQLVEESVLLKDDKEFSINTEWVKESKHTLDNLYEELTKQKVTEARVDAVGEDISVFTFTSLNELMKFWQALIDDWFKKFKEGDYPYNCYQGAHTWEGLMHLETEEKVMGQLKKKGIRSYSVTSGKTLLDRNLARFYNKIGVKTVIASSSSSFEKSYYVATYGELVVQATYPKELVEALDAFFKKNKTLDGYDVSELLDIVNKPVEMKLTVIKNLQMAKHINKSIIEQID